MSATPARYPFAIHVPLPDGTTQTFNRWADDVRFAIIGQDRIGTRNGEPPYVADWCGSTEEHAQFIAKRDWLDQYGGEWHVVPVSYSTPGSVYH